MQATDHVWTVKAALDWTVGFLGERDDEHPRRSAEWLLSAATGLSRLEIYAYHDRPLSPEERVTLRDGVKRRATGEPLQYVTGEMPFRHIVLRVERGVFIPRPETEILVEQALEFAAAGSIVSPTVVDLCSGSGCVGCSVAHELPGARVYAVDLSPQAAATTRGNAERLGLSDRLTVLEGDLTSSLPEALLGKVDVVLSNPPYIPSADLPDLPEEVLGYEPHLALDGGADGLDVARRIIEESRRWLRPGGLLAMELDERQVQNAVKLLSEWYEDGKAVRDLTGRDRIAAGLLR
ncbi:MAG: peptide chain release factor N(5)-glutamine methyltransferase [Coriobacteriia bacterium]|nr:peptide chain release factor N(5)-glutamine methyltransferase [Coriobacteriia bacterium]